MRSHSAATGRPLKQGCVSRGIIQDSSRKVIKRARFLAFAVLFVATICQNAIGVAEDREQALQNLVSQASLAQSKGDFAAAADAYRKSVEIDGTIPQLWANLGLMYHQVGDRAGAIQSFKKAIQIDPSLFVPHLFLGIEYLEMREPGTALPFLKDAAKLNPGDPQAAASLGRAYSLLDQADQAAEAFWKAVQLSPADGKNWLDLGTAYLQQVETDARIMISKYENSPYANLRVAETFAEQGKLVEAEAAFNKALVSPAPAGCTKAEYGIVLLRLNKLQEAERMFQLGKNEAVSCKLTSLGEAFEQIVKGDLEPGLSALASIASNGPDFFDSNVSLFRDVLSADKIKSISNEIRVRRDSGELKAEIGQRITRAFATEIGYPIENQVSAKSLCAADSAHKVGTLVDQEKLASCYYFSGDFRNASFAAEFLKANPPTRAQGLYWESKADQKLAIAALTRAGELEPNSPQMWVLIGDVFRQKRRWSEAEADYRKAVALDPKSRTARLDLAIVLFTELENEEAFALDKSLLQERPEDPEANLLAGEILVQQHEYAKAESYLQNCEKLGDDLQPRRHVLLAQVYAETDRVPQAIAEYKRGLTSDRDGSIHYQLARLYQKSGKAAEATELIRISKQLREHWDNQAHVAMEQRSTDLSRQ